MPRSEFRPYQDVGPLEVRLPRVDFATVTVDYRNVVPALANQGQGDNVPGVIFLRPSRLVNGLWLPFEDFPIDQNGTNTVGLLQTFGVGVVRFLGISQSAPGLTPLNGSWAVAWEARE